MACARRNATTIEDELLSSGSLNSAAYYEMLAKIAGLPFLKDIPAETVVVTRQVDAVLRSPRLLRTEVDGIQTIVVAPEARGMESLRAFIDRPKNSSTRMAVAAPETIRKAVWACRAQERVEETVRGLFESDVSNSARLVLTGRQGIVLGLLLSAFVAVCVSAPAFTRPAAHAFLSMLFFACIALRILALAARRPPARRTADICVQEQKALPIYTVAVALHKEAAVVDQLVRALSRLRWPRSRLEIKLICESDDDATLHALSQIALPRQFEVIRVPAHAPRTKPKALHYALSGARGEFLVIYDAEDRPQPDQLLEAHALFSRSDRKLAYVQAPLVVANGKASSISALFALEYSGLFRGLLPFLAHHGLPMPLGGTSNHFRMSVLRESGAWDPYNVTEDADLGMRLFRKGFRGGVIRRATIEDAPVRPNVWFNQRTRWFKGWLQTWLVMMRHPCRLWREMGPAGFGVFQILIGGMLCSALLHPLLIIFILSALGHPAVLLSSASDDVWNRGLLFLDLFNLAGGYTVFLLLGYRSMGRDERRRIGLRWLLVPVYWFALTLASWRAVFELVRKPFYWSKTPHCPAVRASMPAGPDTGYR